mmetsp:Transcript_126740/g.320102  ORF Transcript_126740/g.320102 Transcript_126740/m.320102 type:complete len:223 (-) Transcript_126740:1365-2033(-)
MRRVPPERSRTLYTTLGLDNDLATWSQCFTNFIVLGMVLPTDSVYRMTTTEIAARAMMPLGASISARKLWYCSYMSSGRAVISVLFMARFICIAPPGRSSSSHSIRTLASSSFFDDFLIFATGLLSLAFPPFSFAPFLPLSLPLAGAALWPLLPPFCLAATSGWVSWQPFFPNISKNGSMSWSNKKPHQIAQATEQIGPQISTKRDILPEKCSAMKPYSTKK